MVKSNLAVTNISENLTPDTLVIVLSKTPEKVAHFEVAAKGSRVNFIDGHRISLGYKVAVEDTGDRLDNAKQKFDAVGETITKLKDPNSPEFENLQEQCRLRGIPFNPDKIFIMVEDSTFTIDDKVWPKFKELLRKYAPDSLLEINKQSGPDAETGPIVSATGGFLRFYNLLAEAYEEALTEGLITEKDIPAINNQCTIVLRRLSDSPDQEPLTIDTHSPYQLLQIDETGYYIKEKPLVNYFDYVALPESPTVPVSENIENYITKTSPRGLAFQELLAYLEQQDHPTTALNLNAAASEITQNTQPQTEATQLRHFDVQFKSSTTSEAATIYPVDMMTDPDLLTNEIYRLINCDDWIGAHDAFTFGSFDCDNYEERVTAFLYLINFVVNKQLIARDMFKTAAVIDDGCWTDFIALLASLANKGMAKNFEPLDGLDLSDEDIAHYRDAYIDCFEYDPNKYGRENFKPKLFSDAQLQAAQADLEKSLKDKTQAIFDHRSQGYHHFTEPTQQLLKEGVSPQIEGQNRFMVAHFVSATSDNLTLNQNAAAIGRFLADIDAGYVYGGMKNHSGGAGFHAYQEAGGNYAAAISTPSIIATENEDQELPTNADYRELSPDIYHRMARMLAVSDVIIIEAGGLGTLQELLVILEIKNKQPELFADKKIIINNTNIHQGNNFSGRGFWSRALETTFKVSNRNEDFSSVAHKDLYIAENRDEVQKIVRNLKREWQKNHRVAALPSPQSPTAATPQPTGP